MNSNSNLSFFESHSINLFMINNFLYINKTNYIIAYKVINNRIPDVVKFKYLYFKIH
jgi:hypothetical protein